MGTIIQPSSPRMLVFGGTATNIAASTTIYAGLGIVNATLSNVAQYPMTFAGTFVSLYARTTGNIGATTETWTVTLFKNGSATALTFVMTGAVIGGSDTAHSVTFVPGDYIMVQVVASAGTTGRPGVFSAGIA